MGESGRAGARQILTVAVFMLVAFGLGVLGAAHYLAGRPLSDVLYLALQTFVLQLPASDPAQPYPWPLDVARFLAPLALGYTAIITFLLLFRTSVDALRARWLRGHVVVCGLGSCGQQVVRALSANRRRVVAVELATRPHGGTLHVPTIVGDAREPGILAAAGVARAARVVITCGDDGVNGEIAAALAERVRRRDGSVLECQVQVSNADLADRLRRSEVRGVRHGSVLFDFFCVHQVAARRLLMRYPPFADEPDAAGVLVVGDAPLAASVVAQTARLWSASPNRPRPIPVCVVAPAATEMVQRLYLRHPQIGRVCDLTPCDADPLSGVTAMAASGGISRERRAYVCLEDEAAGLAVAGALIESVDPVNPVIVQTSHQRGLTDLAVQCLDPGSRIEPFGVTEMAYDPNGLFGDMWYELARGIHESYRARRVADPTRPAQGPEMAPWEELAESYRAANLDQARYIGSRLAEIGARPVPLLSPQTVPFRFTAAEVEHLAELEHARWDRERRAAGWTLGPKNTERRRSPYLVPYDELPAEVQDYDREAVRAIPSLLAAAGYGIVRQDGSEPGVS